MKKVYAIVEHCWTIDEYSYFKYRNYEQRLIGVHDSKEGAIEAVRDIHLASSKTIMDYEEHPSEGYIKWVEKGEDGHDSFEYKFRIQEIELEK